MSVKLRVLATVGIFLIACCGCQKGSRQADSGSPDMAEAAKADAKAPLPKKTPRTTEHAPETPSNTAPKAGNMLKGALTQADNGMEFDFRQGQTITVVLDSNRGSGLSWALVEPMGGTIVPAGGASYAVKAGKNQGGTETWHFRAAKAGYQTVKMEYRRKYAQSMPERTFRFSANVR
ncbi:MAG TPA: protease inhibitor I42 family protein [Candidatus Polarisedimenticolia bacterium]|nr:protease inhibitor I42 family protein [Candidatus Polarisedimenticolia bacterium]